MALIAAVAIPVPRRIAVLVRPLRGIACGHHRRVHVGCLRARRVYLPPGDRRRTNRSVPGWFEATG